MEGGISFQEAADLPMARRNVIIKELEKIGRERDKAAKKK